MKTAVKRALCLRCGKYVQFVESINTVTTDYRGVPIQYNEYIARCKKCREPVDAFGLWDKTLKAIQDAYKMHRLETNNSLEKKSPQQPQSKETDN